MRQLRQRKNISPMKKLIEIRISLKLVCVNHIFYVNVYNFCKIIMFLIFKTVTVSFYQTKNIVILNSVGLF